MAKQSTNKSTSMVADLPHRGTIVRYKYIPRNVRGITNKAHVLYGGKLDGAIDRMYVLRDPSGRFVLPMTDTEKEYIISSLGIREEDLNVNNRNNSYLQKLYVEMPKHGIQLDTSDAHDLLLDKVLLAYDNVIAPNTKSISHKASYRYVRVEHEEETDIILENSDKRKEAYKLLGSLETSREKMIMYLLNEGVRISKNISQKDLRKLVNERVELSYSKFIAALNDPLFVELGIINMAIILNVIEEVRGLYYYQSLPLAAENEQATLTNAAKYLADKANSSVRIQLSKETLDAFNGT